MNAFYTWQHAILKSSLEPTTKLVCHTIGCHMAMDGTGCFPSYALIAEESGLGRRTVIEHVQKAADAGFLVIQSRERENGSSTTNLYQPVIPGGVQQPHPGGAAAAPGVVQQPHPHNIPSLTTQINTPQPPKGEGRFEEIWKAKWSRGDAPQPRKTALKAYLAAIKAGADHDAVLAAVRSRVGVEKEGTQYAPHLATWLNQERWKDGTGKVVASAEEVEAARKRIEEAERRHREEMAKLTEQRRKELGLTA